MLFREYYPEIQVNLLATDIDSQVIELAKQGFYKEKSLKELPIVYKQKYFTKDRDLYKIDPKIRPSISFKKHNLLKDQYPKEIDLILCRNVLTYFTNKSKDLIYSKFSQALSQKGILFVGSTEHILNQRNIIYYY